ncbi:F0F1 ATP synthase subunit delta [Nocardioides terrisoli]|uniref:F0F1 ATP synthase subunit delta n=1 Tax=Nocardioides terrisoli TaxID=3388267 RepID=UPI00287B9046|nr:F0F1 ATP synthase subunit delta [Nocardioides marmorisolisilvae]
MRGSSAESFTRISSQQARAIADGADAARMAENMFTAVAVFRSNPSFRRAATDPTAEFENRSAMLREVFGKHFEPAATEVLATAGGSRWASSVDMVDSLERLGVIAVARAADSAGEADRLEGEMFTFDNVISENPALRQALTDRTRSVEDKQALLRSLLASKACSGTVRLAEQAVVGNYPTVRHAFADYARLVTEARGRLLARVVVAQPLSEDAQLRLVDVLSRQYDKPVHLNIVIDPETIGGIQVEIGDEVIDGTVASRLSDAQRRLAG